VGKIIENVKSETFKLIIPLQEIRQRRQSGLKSGGSWIRVKIFSGNFTKKSIFQGKLPKNFDFPQVISQNISIFQDKFLKNFDFSGNLKK